MTVKCVGDHAVTGIPSDLATTGRPGARLGPRAGTVGRRPARTAPARLSPDTAPV